jgi:hypothetical protein
MIDDILQVSMPHKYNVAAFEAGAASPHPLLQVYCRLVVAELALKDSGATWPDVGHDVPQLLSDIGEAALSVQLQGRLTALKCTAKDGTEAPVRAAHYPHLRYLRHESDYPGRVKDSDLNAVLGVLADVMLVLRAKKLI